MTLLKVLFSIPKTEPDLLGQMVTDGPNSTDVKPLWKKVTDNRATVTEMIAPDSLGHVKFQGTRWRAASDRGLTLEVGTVVRVIGRRHSNILIVEP